jgi:hypothetical protein
MKDDKCSWSTTDRMLVHTSLKELHDKVTKMEARIDTIFVLVAFTFLFTVLPFSHFIITILAGR